jgi:hypothetical protein
MNCDPSLLRKVYFQLFSWIWTGFDDLCFFISDPFFHGSGYGPYISILDKPSVSSLISEMLLLHYKANINLDGVPVNLGEQWCTDF